MIKELGIKIKEDFPIFKNNPKLVYLDSAATTQKPKVVIDKIVEFYSTYNSNTGRGLYKIAQKADTEFYNARLKIAKFLNADFKEIIFTQNSTTGLNSLCSSITNSFFYNSQFNVLTTEIDHSSNYLPWLNTKNCNVDFAKVQDSNLVFNQNKKYHVVSVPLTGNVTANNINILKLKKLKCLKDAIFIVDATQAVAHKNIDIKELDVEFLVFSGHKIFGPTGVGVIYGKETLLQKMKPFNYGGGMAINIEENLSKIEYKELPFRFEAGTQAIAEAIALGSAIDYIQNIGFESIQAHEEILCRDFFDKIKKIPQIKIINPSIKKSRSVFAFTIDVIHPHDIADYLASKDICVRAGNHCAQILQKRVLKSNGSVRVSFSIYNTIEDIDILVNELKNCIKLFKK